MGGNKRTIVEMESFEGNEKKGEEHIQSLYDVVTTIYGHNIQKY